MHHKSHLQNSLKPAKWFVASCRCCLMLLPSSSSSPAVIYLSWVAVQLVVSQWSTALQDFDIRSKMSSLTVSSDENGMLCLFSTRSKVGKGDFIFQLFIHSFLYLFCRQLNTVFKNPRRSELLEGSNPRLSSRTLTYLRPEELPIKATHTHTGIFYNTEVLVR